MKIFRLLGLMAMLMAVQISLSFSQSNLTGTVVDAADNLKLEKATVTLLSPNDSILQAFVWTKEGGKFTINNIDTGEYILIVAYPQYADLVQPIHIKESSKDISMLKLSKASLLLDEVLITGKIPIVIKGDTIEYDADSFKVDKDAKVEDLLKVLPGISIDANGKITAQGKEVQRVLLDGEEFFGNDPKLITKNIRSDMVDKVQVYEKRTDIADKTGIDDGERIQTIDIKLKEDKKKGTFGDVLAGVGTNSYYAGKAMANRFKGPQKISVYGVTANDGMVGLNFEEGQKYGTSSYNMEMSSDGYMMFSSSGGGDGMDEGSYYGNGIPRALNLGVSYSDKLKGDKHKLNVNYRRGQMDVENNNIYFAQNNLPEQARIDSSYTYSDNAMNSNIANIRYDLKLDSLSDMILTMRYNQIKRENLSNTDASQQDLDYNIINQTTSQTVSDNTNQNVSADILLTKRFMKPRRSVTLNMNVYDSDYDNTSNFYTNTRFASTNTEATIDQYKIDNTEVQNIRGGISYAEPLSKYLTGTLAYNFSKHHSFVLNESYNKNIATSEYDQLDESVLNDFDNDNWTNSIRTSINYKIEKLTINVGNSVDFEQLSRTYNNLSSTLNRNRTSFTPNLSTVYQFTKNKSIRVNYYGRSIQPGLDQIEPLKQNAQQLVQYVDNFELKSGFSNSLNWSYNSYKPLKSQSFYIFSNIGNTVNAINSRVDMNLNTGMRTIQFVNIDRKNWNASVSSNYSFLLNRKQKLNGSIGLGMNFNNTYSYLAVNNGETQLNNNEFLRIRPYIGLSRYNDKGLSFNLSLDPGIQIMRTSLQPTLNSTAFTMSTYGGISYKFPKDILFAINMNQQYEAATKTLASYNNVLVNGFVSKKFLKDKSMEVQLLVNDILNKNIGIRRNQSGYLFTQTSNDVLRRYGMLKLTYSFTSMKGDN